MPRKHQPNLGLRSLEIAAWWAPPQESQQGLEADVLSIHRLALLYETVLACPGGTADPDPTVAFSSPSAARTEFTARPPADSQTSS